MTAEELARLLKVTPRTVYNWDSGRGELSKLNQKILELLLPQARDPNFKAWVKTTVDAGDPMVIIAEAVLRSKDDALAAEEVARLAQTETDRRRR